MKYVQFVLGAMFGFLVLSAGKWAPALFFSLIPLVASIVIHVLVKRKFKQKISDILVTVLGGIIGAYMTLLGGCFYG
ncbi:MAG TPA: hypothetical protein VFZ48_00940 [Candidatus Saccharimonadales bacterium]